jgi:catechol 2,3-dioxygenase-like lactoylglutathione lyase family enzyme
MSTETKTEVNVQQTVPFLWVSNMEASLRFYVEGLGFVMKHQWIPDGKLRWCWLQIGDAPLMLQEYRAEGLKAAQIRGKFGNGVSITFSCKDSLAIYREVTARGIQTQEPFVGNHMWVVRMADPDGYWMDFESPTDVEEETKYSEWKA